MITTMNPKIDGKLFVMADTDTKHFEQFLSNKHLICDAFISERADARVNIDKKNGSFCMQEPYINIDSEPDANNTLIMYKTQYSKSFINSYMECIFDTIMEDALSIEAKRPGFSDDTSDRYIVFSVYGVSEKNINAVIDNMISAISRLETKIDDDNCHDHLPFNDKNLRFVVYINLPKSSKSKKKKKKKNKKDKIPFRVIDF
jgi:hypothetical protein